MKLPRMATNNIARMSVVLILAVLLAGGATTLAARLTSSKDTHFRSADAEARHLLSLLRLPPGSTAIPCSAKTILGSPGSQPDSDHLIDRNGCWRIAMPLDAVVDWIRRHPPRGLTASTNGRAGDRSGVISVFLSYTDTDTAAYREPVLEITIAPDGAHSSVIRADGMTIWVSTAPTRVEKPGPSIQVTVAGGCPTSLGAADDVSNPLGVLTEKMLPSTDPVAAKICEYGMTNEGPSPVRRIDLSPAQARALSTAINRIFLGSTGIQRVHCPMDTGLTDVIVFRYSDGSDVGLWYHASGCPTLDNGYVIALELGNPEFQGNFPDQMSALTR